jgi:hypothetical protein
MGTRRAGCGATGSTEPDFDRQSAAFVSIVSICLMPSMLVFGAFDAGFFSTANLKMDYEFSHPPLGVYCNNIGPVRIK